MTLIIRTVAELREVVRGWKAEGHLVGVVPTMGALHDGHLSLARRAKAECGRVITTIFVNPKQFNNPDDLKKYPRTEDADAALLRWVGVEVVFCPAPEEVYPAGFVTTVSVGGVSQPLEGTLRPGHFDGVATVVAKLFGMTQADRGYFGQKDWQQLQVVQRLVADLNMAVTVVGCETVRDPDGLAVIAEGFESVEYIELRDAETLGPVMDANRPIRMLAAAWLDGVRLIDNIAV